MCPLFCRKNKGSSIFKISYYFSILLSTSNHRHNLRGMRGTGTPLFGLRGTVHPTFQDEKVKNLLSPAVNKGNLRRLNYNKTIFGRGSAPDASGRSSRPQSRMRKDTSSLFRPFSSLFSSGPTDALFSF